MDVVVGGKEEVRSDGMKSGRHPANFGHAFAADLSSHSECSEPPSFARGTRDMRDKHKAEGNAARCGVLSRGGCLGAGGIKKASSEATGTPCMPPNQPTCMRPGRAGV